PTNYIDGSKVRRPLGRTHVRISTVTDHSRVGAMHRGCAVAHVGDWSAEMSLRPWPSARNVADTLPPLDECDVSERTAGSDARGSLHGAPAVPPSSTRTVSPRVTETVRPASCSPSTTSPPAGGGASVLSGAAAVDGTVVGAAVVAGMDDAADAEIDG